MHWSGRTPRWLLWLLMAGIGMGGFPDYAEAQGQEVIGQDGAPMVLVPAGAFTMGTNDNGGEVDERPPHRVTLAAYYMDKVEVTVERYARFLAATGIDAPPDWKILNQPAHQPRPVVNVNHADASAYCRWAGKRLPTEAEWEKAARGTDGRLYPWGNDSPDRQRANYGQEQWDHHAVTMPVGQLSSGQSPYGIEDLAGNVREWTSDWYDGAYYQMSPSQNPTGPEGGERKVLRGGAWNSPPGVLRSVSRDRFHPATRKEDIGFRCVQVP